MTLELDELIYMYWILGSVCLAGSEKGMPNNVWLTWLVSLFLVEEYGKYERCEISIKSKE